MPINCVKKISEQGQSIWLDYIRRDLLETGALAQQIADDGLKGLTSNPAIFEKAIAATALYDAAIAMQVRAGQRDPEMLAEALAVEDIRRAADAFQPVYAATRGVDGYVSLEVSPRLASDTARTLAEARRLWRAVDRPNLMIKVPGTLEAVPVVRALIAEGINVNITLLFARSAYLAVAEAYLQGLEDRIASGKRIDQVASVASFFISRIDTVMDAAIAAHGAAATALAGRVAIANAKLAYQDFLSTHQSSRWQALAAQGAQPQRLLWASTGTKNPALRDTLYVEQLIGAHTVNTVPPATLDAFRDHGNVQRTLDLAVADAQAVMAEVERLGLPLKAATDQLVVDGIQLFVEAWDKLLAALAAKRDALA